MNIEKHFDLIDECINKYKNSIPIHLLDDVRQDIILRLLTKPKPNKEYTDESWVRIVSGGIITNFRMKESKYMSDHTTYDTGNRDGDSSTLLSVKLNCNETEIGVAKMIQAGYNYREVATSFGKYISWVHRTCKSIKNKLKEGVLSYE